MADLFTSDDLDAFGMIVAGEDQREQGEQLIRIVDGNRLADPSDAEYALALAAEKFESAGDLERALELAERAVEESKRPGTLDPNGALVRVGDYLWKLGRTEEAMARFESMRPLLAVDSSVAHRLPDTMEEHGLAELAVDWMTEALPEAINRDPKLSANQAAGTLLRIRMRIRKGLGLRADEFDALAEKVGTSEPAEYSGSAMLVWPRAEFERLVLLWPALSKEFGQTWDDHRAMVEYEMQLGATQEPGPFAVLPGKVRELIDLAGPDEYAPDFIDAYEADLADGHVEIAWPPGRNDECWCGSGAKYKKCCLPRSR
ncbi:SEC-C metal-binding domain-containing protein [Amycolatopsis sp. NPDC059657]|uniref:SEC-C metal-binding domain-containing protein n=1 Tax=Amycolatopsis sp. NPDC059657 TaxID=3346899 RepID=UPI0036705E88